MFSAIDVSTSGLVAQRVRLNAAAMNIAMADVAQTPEGGPYRRRAVEFSVGADAESPESPGVHVSAIRQEDVFRMEYNPGHPLANDDGYVKMPGIDRYTEMVNAMEAQRSYEANVTAVEVSKSMLASSLRLLG